MPHSREGNQCLSVDPSPIPFHTTAVHTREPNFQLPAQSPLPPSLSLPSPTYKLSSPPPFSLLGDLPHKPPGSLSGACAGDPFLVKNI
ncbi:hypothetical protein SLEP1_g4796 [Rubroshorea leprosula]|uniref:Uncharacterized protein n=1 Tax=Rubroshorea leprosula TaxID=152421 RepID=A0AAV5HW90_9ROSI|nr:hypothetical protein SLEP1_g4796 [Rubroshorea leprosula]